MVSSILNIGCLILVKLASSVIIIVVAITITIAVIVIAIAIHNPSIYLIVPTIKIAYPLKIKAIDNPHCQHSYSNPL